MQTDDPVANPSDDLLRGARSIGEYLFGPHTRAARQVYYLSQIGALPVFRLGKTLCARKSALIAWICSQEQGSITSGVS